MQCRGTRSEECQHELASGIATWREAFWKISLHSSSLSPVPVFLLLPAVHPSLPEVQVQGWSLLAAGSPHEWVKAPTQKLSKAHLCSCARTIKKPKEKTNLSFKA